MSSVLQMPLFRPQAIPYSPAAVDVHALSVPAGSFTGDFYFVHRNGEWLWLVVGDVAGKGLNAAVLMAMIQEELEHWITSCALTHCDPAVTMTRLHEFMRPHMPSNRFASAVIAVLHDDGRLQVANAGHPPLLITRWDGSIEEISSTGPVAGLLPSSSWSTARTHLRRGESIALYSDGVIEAANASDEEFGVRLLRSVLAASRTPEQNVRAVVNAVRQHSGSPNRDDLTIVVARR